MEVAKRKLLADIMKQLKELGAAPVPSEQVWFRNLLFALLKSAIIDFRFVEQGARESARMAAWGRRGLMELKVFTDFVLESEANARTFQRPI